MTGYGVANKEIGAQSVTLEIRSLNGRFREVVARLPSNLLALEEPLKKIVGTQINRGRVELRLQIDTPKGALLGLAFDPIKADNAMELLNKLIYQTGVDEPISLTHLLTLGVLNEDPGRALIGPEDLKPFVESLAEEALCQLVSFRNREGEELEKDLKIRLNLMGQAMDRIKGLANEANDILFQRQKERLLELTQKALEPERVAQEAAILAERQDITEEITRFCGHLTAFRQTLAEKGPIGRRLEFLLQELGREANTMGSKSQWGPLTEEVLFLKGELEKAREQALNIE
jgi:uncharacterized protein (TIGR00255 family)